MLPEPSNGGTEADERWVEERLRRLRHSQGGRPVKPLGQILRRLLARRGYAQPMMATELKAAWMQAVGESLGRCTAVGKFCDGVLTIWVSDNTVLQEVAFRKRQIMDKIKLIVPQIGLRDLAFRVAQVSEDWQ